MKEYLLFPKNSYFLTQGFGNNSYSHTTRKALDVSAAGGGYKEIYSPFSGTIKRKFEKSGIASSCWFESDKKVLCANGKRYYIVFLFTHPNMSKIKVGQHFNQGEYMFDDGTTGGVSAHLDLEVAVYDNKEDIKIDWYHTNDKFGSYELYNSVDPTQYIVTKDDCLILNEYYEPQKKFYHFKKVSEVVEQDEYTIGTYQTLDNVRVRTGAGTQYRQKQVKELTQDGQKHATSTDPNAPAYYKKGTLFDALEIIDNGNNDIWARGYSGYVNIRTKDYISSQKV